MGFSTHHHKIWHLGSEKTADGGRSLSFSTFFSFEVDHKTWKGYF
jgi:hypothetical protein